MNTVSSIIVEIKALGGDFTAAWQGYKKQVEDFNTSISNGNAALTKLATAFTALMGLHQLGSAIQDSQDLAEATAQLDQVLKTTGQGSASMREELLNLADTEEQLTGVHKDQVISIEAILFSFGATAEQVKKMMPLVLDISAATGRSAIMVARSLGEAAQGNSNALLALGLPMKQLAAEVKGFDSLMDMLGTRWSGQAQARHEAEGDIGKLKLAFHDLNEAIGSLITGTGNSLFSQLTAGIKSAAQAIQNFPKIHPEWAQAIRDLAAAFGRLVLDVGPFLVAALALNGLMSAANLIIAPLRVAIFALTASFQALTLEVGFNYAALNQWDVMCDASVAAAARLTAALRLLGATLGVIGSAIAGWSFGRMIGDMHSAGQSINQWVTETELEIAAGISRWLARIQYLWDQAKTLFSEGVDALVVVVREGALKIAQAWNKIPHAPKIDTRELEASLAEARAKLDAVRGQNNKAVLDATIGEIDRKLQQDIATVEGIYNLFGKVTPAAPVGQPAGNVYSVEGGPNAEAQKQLDEAQKIYEEIHKSFISATGHNRELVELDYQAALVTLRKKIKDDELYEIAKYELHAVYLAKLAELDQKRAAAESENKRAAVEGQIRGIQGNPLLTNDQKSAQAVPLQRQLLDLDNQRAAALQKLIAASDTPPDTQLLAQKQLLELTQHRADLENQNTINEGRNSFQFQSAVAWKDMQDKTGTIAKDAADVMVSPFEGMRQGVANAFDQMMLKGANFSSFMRSVGLDIYKSISQSLSNMVADFVVKNAMMVVKWAGTQLEMVALHSAGETAKTGATATGASARGGIRLAETIFHGALVAIRVAAHIAGEIASTVATQIYAAMRAMYHAIVAAIAAIESEASVPYVGVALGIAAGAAIMAAAMALMGGFAEGGYTGAGPISEIAGVVHRGEYVLPASRVNASTMPLLQAIHSGSLADLAAPGAPNINASTMAGGRGAPSSQPVSVKVINVGDYKQAALEAMASPAGEEVHIMHALKPGVKTKIGSQT